MEKVGPERLLYVDTDNVYFIQGSNEHCPLKIGLYLGNMTEVISEDCAIDAFICLGPKNYC